MSCLVSTASYRSLLACLLARLLQFMKVVTTQRRFFVDKTFTLWRERKKSKKWFKSEKFSSNLDPRLNTVKRLPTMLTIESDFTAKLFLIFNSNYRNDGKRKHFKSFLVIVVVVRFRSWIDL